MRVHVARNMKVLFMLCFFGHLSQADVFGESPARSKETVAGIYVNGSVLTAEQRTSLEQAYGAIQPGRYWYDRLSGLWGAEDGPVTGQIMAGLDLGGALQRDASHGHTKVFINGRELLQTEVAALEKLGPVNPGRYWMNAQGIGGLEGGPAAFDLGAALRPKQGGGTYGGWNQTTPGGHLGGDDNCSYWFDPKSGSSVMNCK